jgi:glycosyltransferase involved in cell wall biosynthesis
VTGVQHQLNNPPRLMITAFGWNDAGGGTTVPRLAAKELARRGWDVTVFHAAMGSTPQRIPCEVIEWEEDGVRLLGVYNRPTIVFDVGNPLRELDDPLITQAFAEALDRIKPDVVHFHNLHGLGAALIEEAAVRGLPAFFSTHNYWLFCPRAYLLTGQGTICNGPGDGARCAPCAGSTDVAGHQLRLAAIRAKAEAGISRILAVSDAVRHALVGVGYSPGAVDVVRQAMPHEAEIWEQVGARRAPGRLRERLTVAFLGSAYPHKGPQLLVAAAQKTTAKLDVRVIGEIGGEFAAQLRRLDARGVVSFQGSFDATQLAALLDDVDVAVLPSMWWDCAPLAAAECLAARVPLVVPRLGGLPESIREGVDGLVFNGLDADDLALQLERIAGEPGLLEQLQASIVAPRAFSDYVDELETYYRGEREPSADAPGGIAAGGIAAGAPDGPERPAPALRWQGDHGQPTSLSIINDEITSRLPYAIQRADRSGHNVDGPLPHPADVEVHHQWPPDFSVAQSGRLAMIVPWEFGAIPRKWQQSIDSIVDELWVPSEFVRQMYVDSGIAAETVHVIANGVDLETFRPATAGASGGSGPRRFLYVGGITRRKGIDLLIDAWDKVFAERDDAVLVIKAANAGGVYGGSNTELQQRAADPQLPRIELIEDDIDSSELGELYRSCDVFVLPYRGEGFAMPVLEAMASGLPVIVTADGPTDEFCPPEAGWRIRAERLEIPREDLPGFEPEGVPWMLEPDLEHLMELLETAATADPTELSTRGAAGRAAAEHYSWDVLAETYRERIAALAATPNRRAETTGEPFPLAEDARLRVLATPAWQGSDQLAELLGDWGAHTTPGDSACLYLLADPALAGDPEQIEARVVEAAERGGLDLEDCADINVLIEPFQVDRDARLHLAMTAFVPLHPASSGHARMARAYGSEIVEPGSTALKRLLASTKGR